MDTHMGLGGNGAPPSSLSAPVPAGPAAIGVDNSSSGQEKGVLLSSNEDWDSESKLVTALSMLQQMEAKIHGLRTLVPNRLLSPLIPIVNPDIRTPIPKSPQEMFEQLSQTARDGVAEVENFKSEWRSPDMMAIWDRIDQILAESGGEHPPLTGMWERDYDDILKTLNREEQGEKERKNRLEEEEEKRRVASSESGWKDVVEEYKKKDIPITINVPRPADNNGRFSVAIQKLSRQFYVLQGPSYDSKSPREWQVMIVPRGNTSKMETEILDCIRSRERKWDLRYLLDMLCSYADVKRTRCLNCHKLANINAQLPTVRKPTQIESADNKTTFAWNAYHSGCL
ncbi:hypothetical protein RJZ56_003563 [Blastomyces dermatitidis]|uniref:Uncharacterized protein n=3 Tax=Blastomyces TaxID=229219 RepID=A0A179V490_BLAGS|nr:uncharacterized protein BDBG_09254 [Blastomyces gilchristii SLH14081]XP_045278435.1 uncharacterized protein BDCG_07136 [Blastomyces dermatitidis ER-3]EGE78718.1 hypothetical protein BDDG_01655 [Blastomyces dermatitidis ATCC 18188]EQL28340.1 hypothetical protein BDFG_08914 [Blastomyces dermatitidis ATCC 26199]EEQ92016.1 hypothetical protein BDCG_07136 [Blastomyces dermatitidis ER-3]OAT14181.1 hypothetical protein BDBG_09254 [Blastomyces gilchristii SLH14081]